MRIHLVEAFRNSSYWRTNEMHMAYKVCLAKSNVLLRDIGLMINENQRPIRLEV